MASLDPYINEYGVTRDKRRAWFMDQYRNPHESLHTLDEVLGWFEQNGIRFVRALPSTVLGSRFSLDYRRSPSTPSRAGRTWIASLSQVHRCSRTRRVGCSW